MARTEEQNAGHQDGDIEKRKRRVVSLGEAAQRKFSAAKKEKAQGDQPQYRSLLDTGLTYVQLCTTLSEGILADLSMPANRQSYFSEVRKYYQLKIQILMECHQSDSSAGYDAQAFEASESSRARHHNDQLVVSGINIREGADPALLAREQELLSQSPRTPEAEAELQGIREQMKNTAYQDIEYHDPLKLAEVQNEVLDEDTALIQYSVQSDKIFVWVVTRESLFTHEINLDEAKLEANIKQNRRALNNLRGERYKQSGSFLRQELVEPLLENIEAQSCSRIAIAAEGQLNALPFASLKIQDDSGEGKFLVEDYEIVYLPSSTSLAISREQAEAQVAELDPNSVGAFFQKEFSAQAPLPAAESEVEQLAELNPNETDVRSGDEATEENFLEATMAYTILHLVTHGACNAEQFEECYLSLRDEESGGSSGSKVKSV